MSGLRLEQLWLLFLDAKTLLVTPLSLWESHYHGTMVTLCTYTVNFLQGAQKTLRCLSQPHHNPVKQAGSCCPKTHNAQQQKGFFSHKTARLTHWFSSMVNTIGTYSIQEAWAEFPIAASSAALFGLSSFCLLQLTAQPQISTTYTDKRSQ